MIGAVVFGVAPALAQEVPSTNGETAGQSLSELPKEVETGNLANLDKDLTSKLATASDKGTEVNREELKANPGSEKTIETDSATETPSTETKGEEEVGSIPRDFYARELENVNTVIEKEDVETNSSNGQRIDMKEELDKLKKLQNATIHMEFKGYFDLHYRLKGTDQELAATTVDNNKGKEYDVSFVHRFQAKEITGYRAVNESLEATIQQKGVNQVIFEYEKIEDPKPVTPVTPVVDPKDEETEIAAYGPLPSKAQLDYHKEELAAFIHYGMNTYTNSEWGNGRENPQNFNPTNLDTDQWIKTLKDAGFKRTIMVVKHHDGFVIYPSKYTDHTVASSPWKDGKGDLLEEISKSATKYDMNMGVYLSPWDANNPKYHVSTEKEYNEYYLNQLKEILGNPKYGNKGKFIEVWMDGARGSGAQKVTYTFDEWFKYIKEAEGDIAIFSAQPTSVRWIGNERGIAGDPVWHKVKKAKITDDVKNDYLNHGDPEGDMYSVGEADVSIRSGWFYHDNQQPKSIKDLMDIYFKSVGRGTPLLLNIPPNKEGKFAEADVARLQEFRATLDQMYATDFAKGATVTASSTRKNHLYQASNLTDGKDDTSWALSNDAKTGEFTVDLGQKRRFDVVELKEDIAKGQRISGFKVEVELNGRWVPYGEGSTVGYRRLVQGQPVEAQKIRVTITNSQATPILTNFSVYKTPSSIEKTDGYPLGLDYHSNTTADKANTTWYDESEGVRGTSMWTNQKDASVTYRFNGTKAYVVSTVDPNHGEMSVYVDGQKVADVQTNNAARKRSQMVYETDDLAPGEHTIKLVNKTGKAIATEGIYTLNNAGKGMFELKETTYEVQKGQPVTVTIKRVGGSKGAATVHVVTEPGTGVHGKVYKDTTADLTFQEGETEKTLTIPTIDFTEQADSIFDFKVKMTSASDEALLGFASEATIRVMKAELLQKDQVSHDDQASQLDYSPGWHHETNSSGKYQNTESWASFGRLTEEQKKNASVTAYFYGTGLEIKGFVDPGHGIYKVTLDGKELEYQDGQGNATDVNGKKYFSGIAATRQGDQTLVRLTGLEEGWHAVTLQLDPKRNDTSRNIGIQVDQFITRGEDSALYTKEELVQAMKNWKDELAKFDQTSLKNTPEARQAFKSNLDKLSEQLSASPASAQEILKTATALQAILDKEENYGVEETPSQPEEPNYDKAMASLTEAIERKTKELGDDKEAKKKLVELAEQALTAIQEAKTQDAVDKALQAALASINSLQATPKEEVKHSTVPAEGDKVLVQTQPSLEVTTEPIAFNTVRRENSFLAKGKEQVVSDGKAGQVTTYVEVDGDTRKTVKVEREEAQDRVIEVGTYEGTSEPAAGVKELSFSQPSLEVVEEVINFKKVKQEDSNLPKGETRVTQVGRAGKERILTEVASDGSRTIKLREVVEIAQDEIVLVGTKKEESGKTDPAIHEAPEFTGGVSDSEAAIHNLPEFTGSMTGSEGVTHGVSNVEEGVPSGEAASHQESGFTSDVTASETTMNDIVDKNDEKSYVVPAMLEDKTYQAPANRQEVLPKTGSEDGSALASVGIMGMFLGMIGMVKRKKD